MKKTLRPPCLCCNEPFIAFSRQKFCDKPECQKAKKEKQREELLLMMKIHNKNRRQQMKDDLTIMYHGKKHKCQNPRCGKLSHNRFLCPSCREQALNTYAGINGQFNVNA